MDRAGAGSIIGLALFRDARLRRKTGRTGMSAIPCPSVAGAVKRAQRFWAPKKRPGIPRRMEVPRNGPILPATSAGAKDDAHATPRRVGADRW